jgi:dimethylargininase
MIILTRTPSNSLAQAQLTHLARVPINYELAKIQHQRYCTTLSQLVSDIQVLPALTEFPDSVFVEDVFISLPDVSILCRPGAKSRLGEVDAISTHVPNDRPAVRLESPARIDGGDVLVIGKKIFIGQSSRTNSVAIKVITEIVTPFGYSVTAVKVLGALHLKTAVTALSDDLLVMNSRWINTSVFSDWRRLCVADSEPFAGNILKIANTIFVQSTHIDTANAISAAGFQVQLIDISEFAKAEAGLTCMSVIIQ